MPDTQRREPIVITHEGGLQFAAQIRSHRVVVDQSHRGGGRDSGPAPTELLGAALGTCVALYVKQFLEARQLPYDGLRVEVDQYRAANPGRIGRFVVNVVVPSELPPAYVVMLERVVRSCPVHNTLTATADVDVALRTAPSHPKRPRIRSSGQKPVTFDWTDSLPRTR